MADDKNPFLAMFQDFGAQMKIPGPDLNKLMETHQKNLAALQAATEVGTASAQAVMEKQRAAFEQALSDIAEAVQVGVKPDAGEVVTSQLDLAKRSFDATVANATEIGEIIRDGNVEAFALLKDRVSESLEELMGGAGPAEAAPAPAKPKAKPAAKPRAKKT